MMTALISISPFFTFISYPVSQLISGMSESCKNKECFGWAFWAIVILYNSLIGLIFLALTVWLENKTTVSLIKIKNDDNKLSHVGSGNNLEVENVRVWIKEFNKRKLEDATIKGVSFAI